MLRYTPEIFYGIERYLIDHKIPCCAHENAGIITFRALCEKGKDEYEYQVNVSERSFWIKAAAPVEVPQKEKVIRRMEKFCNQVNLRDDAGGFLVMNEGRGELQYRLKALCFGDPQEVIGTMLPLPAQMLDDYKAQMELLVRGKRSVNEAMKYFRSCRRREPSCLLPPREENGVHRQELQYSDRLRELMEAYVYRFENRGEVEKS